MPRVSRLGGARKKSGGRASTSHACSPQASTSTNDPPSFEARHQSPLPSIEAPPSIEALTQAKTQHCGRQSSKYWTVDVIDDAGVTKIAHLKLKDLWGLPNGARVMLPLDDYNQPVGEAAGLLGQALGQLGFDFAAFPIGYKSWSKVPGSCKEEVYNKKLKEKFVLDDDLVKKTILKRIGEKWKDNRSELFHRFYNTKISKEENCANPPLDIDRDQWTQFVEYRLHPNTMKMCKRNAKNRKKLLVVHTSGSKTLARKRYEMEVERKQRVGRGILYVATHTRGDGSYVNDAAKTICENILHVESQGSCSQEIAPDDSLGQVLGKERSGRVRGMGLGPCPSQVFGLREHNGEGSSDSNNASEAQMQQEIIDLQARLKKETQRIRELEDAVFLYAQYI